MGRHTLLGGLIRHRHRHLFRALFPMPVTPYDLVRETTNVRRYLIRL